MVEMFKKIVLRTLREIPFLQILYFCMQYM